MATKIISLTPEYNYAEEKESNVVGKRIIEARKNAGYSIADLCEELSKYGITIGVNAVSKWERGVSIPSAYQLLALCAALSIADGLDYFYSKPALNNEGRKKLSDYKELLIASGKYKPTVSRHIKYIEMPVSFLPASAGTGAFLDDGNFEMVSFPETAIPQGAEFGIRVAGDSMEPVYHDGQIVWVQECSTLRPGEVGIFVYDGSGYLKLYEEQEPADKETFTDSYGMLHMQPVMVSYNPAYSDIVVSPNTGFQIVGRVL